VEADISILLKTGHFYFALTQAETTYRDPRKRGKSRHMGGPLSLGSKSIFTAPGCPIRYKIPLTSRGLNIGTATSRLGIGD
jgi:hypothetical protein